MRLGRPTPAGVGEFGGDAAVVASDALHGDEEQRHGDGDDPGAVVNFVIRTMIKTMAVKVAPTALIACERRILGRELLGAAGQFALPVSDHSKLGEGEGHEDTNDVQLDDRADVGVEGHDQGDGKQSKQDDAVAVDEAVAAVVQLARQEAVGGKQGGQQRKAVEGGVGGQDQMAAVAAWR